MPYFRYYLQTLTSSLQILYSFYRVLEYLQGKYKKDKEKAEIASRIAQ
jgi:hypothetical protein